MPNLTIELNIIKYKNNFKILFFFKLYNLLNSKFLKLSLTQFDNYYY